MLFDTSSIIGAIERRNPAAEALIDSADDLPMCHFVSLGELESGVRAGVRDDIDADRLLLRHRSLEFAGRMPTCPMPSASDIACFGVIVANTGRKLSHNDQWILSAAIVHGFTLVTEDERLHDAAIDPILRAALVSQLGHPPVESIHI